MDTLMALRHVCEQGHGAVDLQHAGGVDTARIRCRQIIDSLKGMPAKIQWVLDTQAGTAR